MRTQPRTILLFGGSSDIGLSIVRATLGTLRATAPDTPDSPAVNVLLAGRHSRARTAAATRLSRDGHRVITLAYDANYGTAQVRAVFDRAVAAAGDLDLIIVSVGQLRAEEEPEPAPVTQAADPAAEPKPELFVQPDPHGAPTQRSPAEPGLEALLTTNLVGPALIANEAAAALCLKGHGQLVVLTSAAAARPRGEILGYAVAKQALDAFVRGLDRRTRPLGVRCVVVRPGRVRTRMTAALPPVPLTVNPDQVAARVIRGLQRRSGVVWAPAVIAPITLLLRATPTWAMPRSLR